MSCELNARLRILFLGTFWSSSDCCSCKFLNSLLFSATYLFPFCLQCVYNSSPLFYHLFIYYHEIKPVNDLFCPWNYVCLVPLNAGLVSTSDASEVKKFFRVCNVFTILIWHNQLCLYFAKLFLVGSVLISDIPSFCGLINFTMLRGIWLMNLIFAVSHYLVLFHSYIKSSGLDKIFPDFRNQFRCIVSYIVFYLNHCIQVL
jgi:hypothetical protein